MTWTLRAGCAAVLATVLVAGSAQAQGEIAGRVLAADSGRLPIAGAQAAILKLGRSVTTDSTGRFRLRSVPPGEHGLVVRAIGFRAESSTVVIESDEVISTDIVMRRADGTVLPERVVTALGAVPGAKFVEFIERQKSGVGRFLTRELLAKAEGGRRQTGDLISLVPGVKVRRGSNKIWVASGRAVSTGCAFCGSGAPLNQADFAAGARPACFMDVYVDGALVFDSKHPEYGLFDINTVPPEHIEGIEVYTSAAQIPAKYNRTASGCGVLLIWTR